MTAASSSPRNWRSYDCLMIVAAEALFAAIARPFVNTPFVDDWVYAWSVENLLATGRLQILEFASNVDPAQILWGALFCLPFGFSFTALRVSTWVLAVAGLCVLYLVLRDLEVARIDALMGTACLGVYPIFAVFSATFMTDVPFVSLSIATMYAMGRATCSMSGRWLVVAAVMASLAVAIRPIGLMLPVAMVVTVLTAGGRWGRRVEQWCLAVSPVGAGVAVMLWYPSHVHQTADLSWIINTPEDRIDNLRFALSLLPGMLGETLALTTGTLGIALLPLSIGCVRSEMLPRAAVMFGALVAALAAWRLAGVTFLLPLATGQTWSWNEVGGTSALVSGFGGSVPDAISWVAFGIGVLSCSVLLAWVVRLTWKGTVVFSVVALAGHTALTALLWLIHDHYLLPFVPYAIVLVMSGRPRIDRRLAGAALGLFAFVSAAGIADQRQYARLLWNAVEQLQRSGVADRDIDGGYIVNGWLQYAHPERAYRDADGAIDIPWINSRERRLYTISNEAEPGTDVIASWSYEPWLAPRAHLYVLKARPSSR
jgi:hypothetical protein